MERGLKLSALVLLASMVTLTALAVQEQDAQRVFQQAEQSLQDGNFQQALSAYRKLTTDAQTPGDLTAKSLARIHQCLLSLRMEDEIDDDLNAAVALHAQDYRVLDQAATTLMATTHTGTIIDQEFSRGYGGRRRNRGVFIQTFEQDRLRALKWRLQALDAAQASGLASDTVAMSELHLHLAETLLAGREDRMAWRLQGRTDLSADADYLDVDQQASFAPMSAPTNEDGQPVFYFVPDAWEDAQSDGQRFRWALSQASLAESQAAKAKIRWADFLNSQFSVQTLQENWWWSPRSTEDSGEDGVFAVHTLSENETIARLASGIQRFELPEEFNPLRAYQQVSALGTGSESQRASWALVQIFLNRRQYPRAATLLEQHLERFPADNVQYRQPLLDGIRQPRLTFEASPPQAAGLPVKMSLLFRNATSIDFSARRVDLEKLLADTKTYYRELSSRNRQNFGGRPGTPAPNLASPGGLFRDLNVQRYLEDGRTDWRRDVEPRANHWDRRLEIETPLKEPGLYLVDAVASGQPAGQGAEHRARTLVWVQRHVIVRKPMQDRVLIRLVDAVTGNAVEGANFEFFGWRYRPGRTNRSRAVEIRNFAARSDAQGQATPVLDQGFQWLTVARAQNGDVTLLDFESFYLRGQFDNSYRQAKAYGVSDRPVYRPGDTVKAKFWLAYPVYGDAKPTPTARTPVTISVHDGQNKRVAVHQLVTDRYGGCELEFPLAKAASLGRYRFKVRTGTAADPRRRPNRRASGEVFSTALTIRVEEYRKPEFEVLIAAPEQPVALGETLNARIQAKYYFGTPVTDAEVHVKVERTTYHDHYYPRAPYDWCFGPGYWWFSEDYSWYPSWNSWRGCMPPIPPWFGDLRWEPPELVLEQSLTLDATGEAVLSIDTAAAKEMFGDTEDHRYRITAEVRDASRRTVTAEGEVIAAREAFKIYSWVDRGFYRVGDAITANFRARLLNGTPVAASGTLDLLKISYDAEAHPSERVVTSLPATTDDQGRFTQQLAANQPGQYRVRLRLRDEAGHEVEGGYIFTVRGRGVTGQDFRYAKLELTPDRAEYRPGDTVQLQIAAEREDATVAVFIRPSNGVYEKPRFVRLHAKSSVLEIPVVAADQPNFFVEAYTVYDGRVHHEVQEIFVPPEQRVLDVQLSSNKAEYLPGEEAEVTLQVHGMDGRPIQGSCVLAAYDRSLEQIAPDTLPPDIREFFWKWRRHHMPQQRDSQQAPTYPVSIVDHPQWTFLGIFGKTLADDLDAVEGQKLASGRRPSSGMRLEARTTSGPFGGFANDAGLGGYGGEMPQAALMPMEADAFSRVAPAAQTPAAPRPQVRKDFADTALWVANLETNAQGVASAKFKMPENLTGWKLRSWVVGDQTRVGSDSVEAVTRKPLLVRLQTPRFLVERDEVVCSAIVHNDLPETKRVEVELQIDGETQLELAPGVPRKQTLEIKAHEQARLDWRCRALAEGTVTLRVFAVTDTASDAMELPLPIVVHGMLKTDSWAGTVRADEGVSTVTVKIPDARRVEQSKLTVRLSPSLAAAMTDALPYLASYPYGCTEQTLNRFLPTLITHKILREMDIDLDDIRRRKTNLNAQELGDAEPRRKDWQHWKHNPVYDSQKVTEMVEVGVQRLTDMQNQDGGWGWFPGRQSRSTAHLTASVVRGLLVAKENEVAIVPDVLQRGLAWLNQYQAGELQKLTNWASKTKPYKSHPDNTDALVFHVLTQAGRKDPAMQNMLFEQRRHLSVYGKALLAWATHKTGDAEQTRLLRQNIEQFVVQDEENETAYLADDTAWWYWYGSQIEATAIYLKLLAAQDPRGITAPRLVKYLLNHRKHATYWNSTRDTALVVEAFGDYLRATGETQSDVEAEVWLSGKRLGSVHFTPDNLFEVDNTIQIAAGAVPSGEHPLEIRRSGRGNLYWNVYSANFTLEENIEKAGLEVQVERRYYHLQPVVKDITLAGERATVQQAQRSGYRRVPLDDSFELASGELVEVELIVVSKNDYEYLLIEDHKPAGLEAVDTASGYFYSNGLSIYREMRDRHIGLCLEHLPRGTYSIRYQLRSEAPGTFTALPATIAGMYAPELAGNSEDFDLHVVD